MMPKLVISARAKIKMDTAIDFMGHLEVTGIGIIKRISDKKYILTDMMFPPQENEAAFVTTKDDEFPQWFFEYIIKKEMHTSARLHFHTHPRFGTRPSGTDVQQFVEFMDQVDDYMIQLIVSGNRAYKPFCMIHYVDGRKEQMEIEYEYQDKVIPILKKVTNPKRNPSLFDIPFNKKALTDDPIFIEKKEFDELFLDEGLGAMGACLHCGFPTEGEFCSKYCEEQMTNG